MKKLLLLPTLLLALNLGAATTEPTITTSPKKERSLKQRHDKWVAKNPIKNGIISPIALTSSALMCFIISKIIKPLDTPLALTAASCLLLIPIKVIYDWKKQNDYSWKKLDQINQLKKEITKLKQQQ